MRAQAWIDDVATRHTRATLGALLRHGLYATWHPRGRTIAAGIDWGFAVGITRDEPRRWSLWIGPFFVTVARP